MNPAWGHHMNARLRGRLAFVFAMTLAIAVAVVSLIFAFLAPGRASPPMLVEWLSGLLVVGLIMFWPLQLLRRPPRDPAEVRFWPRPRRMSANRATYTDRDPAPDTEP